MLLIIPTFRRINCLKWVLLSLFQAQKTYPLPESEFRLCIINNHPPTRDSLERLIVEIRSEYAESSCFEWMIVHREVTLDPVINWYSAIDELAKPDELILLHGDDDLFMPWGVLSRYEAMRGSGADILLSRSAHGLLFLPDAQNCLLSGLEREVVRNPGAKEVGMDDIDSWGPAFIGNHCYRNTPEFREAVKLSFQWCHEQDWLDENTRTLMLPYYLPFALKKLGGRLYGIDETCVLRGSGLEEVTRARFGVSGWNPGFLVWCAYGVLSNKELTSIESAKESLNRMASDWFLTFFFDKRIPLKMLRETIKKIGFPLYLWRMSSMAFGVRLLLTDSFGLRRLKDRLSIKREARPVKEVLLGLLKNT